MKVMTVVGARPQFIKAAVLSRLMRSERYNQNIKEILIHTGQHYDKNMSEVFFREMEIPQPDINLNCGSGSHGAMTGKMLAGIEDQIIENKPDILLVYGDTNSTLAGALAASKLHVPVAHVEAGLRSYMMAMPEEQNRRLADNLSSWLFCPTGTAIENLKKEGIVDFGLSEAGPDHKKVVLSGDIMLDASLYYRTNAAQKSGDILKSLPYNFCLLTIHRAENTDDPSRLTAIVSAINEATGQAVVFPVHPRTRKILAKNDLHFGSHVHLIDPVGYHQMLCLEEACSFVLTDSGGVQKEAFFFQKPCITMRDSSEWVELESSGWNKLVGADKKAIVAAMQNPHKPAVWPDLYGSGNAAEKILENLT